MLEHLKSRLTCIINSNKYQSELLTLAQNLDYLDYFINPGFQRLNGLFVLTFQNKPDKREHPRYNLPKVEIKDYHIIINGRNIFNQPVKNNIWTYENIREISICRGDDHKTDCLLKHFILIQKRFSKLTLLEIWNRLKMQRILHSWGSKGNYLWRKR